jgi:hypothetical protein
VWVADPSVFGRVGDGTTLVESLVLGQTSERWPRTETDAEGRFSLDGLLERDYRVETMDPRTLLRVGVDRVAAGSEHLALVLSDEDLYPLVSGRLVSRHGAPVVGAAVFPMCDSLSAHYNGQRIWTRHSTVEGVRTDEEGHFELHDVPKDLVYLRINGDDLISLEHGRGVEGGLKELTGGKVVGMEIEIPLRCHMKVEVAPDSPADSISVLDEAGALVTLNVYEGMSRSETDVVPLTDGRSATLALSDAAATLVLLRGEEELERVPLALTPGEVNLVKP